MRKTPPVRAHDGKTNPGGRVGAGSDCGGRGGAENFADSAAAGQADSRRADLPHKPAAIDGKGRKGIRIHGRSGRGKDLDLDVFK